MKVSEDLILTDIFVEIHRLARDQKVKEKRTLKKSPTINQGTTLHSKPNIPLTELRAQEVHFRRVADGKAKT
jgi:hypothetical protein